jgi:hypothetical protein
VLGWRPGPPRFGIQVYLGGLGVRLEAGAPEVWDSGLWVGALLPGCRGSLAGSCQIGTKCPVLHAK